MLLLALGEVVPGSCSGYRPLEVVDENLLVAFCGRSNLNYTG
jgi:hypothetical protein